MGYALTQIGDSSSYYRADFVCDTEADKADVPTSCTAGSTIFVIETKKVYILTTEKEWKEI